MVIFNSYVSLPEGNKGYSNLQNNPNGKIKNASKNMGKKHLKQWGFNLQISEKIFIFLCLTSKNNRTISDQGIDLAYQSTPTNQEIFRILPEVPQPQNHLSSAG